MNIIVCAKITPDPSDIEARGDGSISLERAEWMIGGFDLPAIEAGVRLIEVYGGTLTVLSAGPRPIAQSKLKKDILSRGPDALAMVVDDNLHDADTAFTAHVLAQAVRKLGDFDLVLCGEGSADLYFQQVGLQLGELLGVPTLNAVNHIALEGDTLLVERDLEDEVEVLEVPLPAVLSVTTDIHEARLPSMKEILKAGKKPVTEWSMADLDLPDDLGSQSEVLCTRAPEQARRKQERIEGAPQEAARKLVDALQREGLL